MWQATYTSPRDPSSDGDPVRPDRKCRPRNAFRRRPSASGPRLSWGDLSILADGVSEWEFFRHNGHAGTTTSVEPDLAHASWSRIKSDWR